MTESAFLRIETFGGVTIQLDGKLVTGLVSRKAEALLVYLFCNRRSFPREVLATLLWEELPQTNALANLSVVLSSLRKQLGPSYITTTRHNVGQNLDSECWLDVIELESQLKTWHLARSRSTRFSRDEVDQLEEGLSHYKGDFLAGFHVHGSQSFEEWATLERERLHSLAMEGLDDLVAYCLNSGRCRQGLDLAHRLLNMDLLRERSHRTVMLLLARCGERNAALAQYQVCRDVLSRELDVEPSQETLALYERIRSIESDPLFHLPPQATPCFGRQAEIAQIAQRLADPGCRLLTILGMGGVGKTRLAIQVAGELKGAFLNGVCFVPLSRISSPDFLVQALAEALCFTTHRKEPLRRQLLDYLREKELLILLDNFEHLREGVQLLLEIIKIAPQVKLLVTSRERLAVREEWLSEIHGLRYPDPCQPEDFGSFADLIPHFGSLQLFMHNASRVQADFTPSREQGHDIIRICSMVEGMPLGIELASAWIRNLPCRTIVNEIESSLDILTTTWRNMPQRHQSIRAVFDHSWKSLSEGECRSFRMLSIISGQFSLDTAQHITGASRATLSSLSDKSLLQPVHGLPDQDEPRYSMHELLRQYAAEHLEAALEEKEQAQHAHCLHFSRFLKLKGQEISVGNQKDALEAIGNEIENLRAAWRYAVETKNIDAISDSLEALFRFYHVRGLYQEGDAAFGAAVETLEPANDQDRRHTLLLGQLLARQAALKNELSHFEVANNLLEQSLALFEGEAAEDQAAFALGCLGNLCRNRGEYEKARNLMQESLKLCLLNDDRLGAANALADLGTVAYRLGHYAEAKESTEASLKLRRELNDQQGIARCLKDLGTVVYRLGDYDEAWRLGTESLRISESIGDRWGVAASSNNLGNVAERRGDLISARDLYQQSVAIKRGIGHRMSMATSLYNLGKIARRLQEFDEAITLYQEALTIIQEIGDQWSLSNAVCGLAEVQVEMGMYDDARRNFRQSLEIAQEIGSEVLMEAALVENSSLMALEGDPEGAVKVLAMIVERPSKEQEIQDRAEQLLAEFRSQFATEALRSAYDWGKVRSKQDSLEELVLEILSE